MDAKTLIGTRVFVIHKFKPIDLDVVEDNRNRKNNVCRCR